MKSILRFLAVAVTAFVAIPAAHAQATRTWVSGVGDDANPCSRTAPCKTFAGAISKTAASGIISVLDPGGFGAVTITKSITLEGVGTLAGILAANTNGINVNDINGTGIKVILRNLSIEGVGTGLVGVNVVSGAQVTIENCKIFGFRAGNAQGIRVATSVPIEIMVKDTNLTDNGTGIFLQSTSGQLLTTLDNVRIENMVNNGIETAGTAQVFVTVKSSQVSHNNVDGVKANTALSQVTIDSSVLAFNNGTSVNAAVSGARIRLTNNTIVNNNKALGVAVGAFMETTGNNRVAGFGSSDAPNQAFAVQ